MALALTITDLADGTGATATITGADSATVTVYVHTASASSWTSAGTRTGNGTVTLSIATGYYFAYAAGTVSGSPAVSPVVGLVAVTSSDQSIQYRLMAQCKAEIQSISASLTGWTSTQIGSAWDINDKPIKFPYIFLTPTGQESYLGGPNQRDDWGRPINISIVDRADGDTSSNLNKYTLWRERIIKHLHNNRFQDVAENYHNIVLPNSIVQFDIPKYQYLVSKFGLQCKNRETRTP